MENLPAGCSFKIISFGTFFDCLDIKGFGNKMVPYTDANLKEAINKIGEFEANYGGTELLPPINDAFE